MNALLNMVDANNNPIHDPYGLVQLAPVAMAAMAPYLGTAWDALQNIPGVSDTVSYFRSGGMQGRNALPYSDWSNRIYQNTTSTMPVNRLQMVPYRKKRKFNPRAITMAQRGYLRTGGVWNRFKGNGNNAWRGEDKFFDIDLSASLGLLTNVENKANMVLIAQGTTESERIGRKIHISSIAVMGIVQKLDTDNTTFTSNMVKFELVVDTQCNGAAYNALDRLETDSIIRFNNLASGGRFKTYKSSNIMMTQTGAGPQSDGPQWGEIHRYFKMFKKCSLVIEYDNSFSTGALSTQRTNTLWFTQIAELNNEANLVRCLARIRYRDV